MKATVKAWAFRDKATGRLQMVGGLPTLMKTKRQARQYVVPRSPWTSVVRVEIREERR